MELNTILKIFIGTLLGFLSGLGVGGGSLLMLWLTLVQKLPRQEAGAVNLMFFIPAALIATWFQRSRGTVSLKNLLPAILSGCISALLFSWLGQSVDTAVLKKGFGVLLIYTGAKELFYRPRELR